MTETADEARRRLVLAALILPVLCAAPVVPALSARAAEPEAPDEEEDVLAVSGTHNTASWDRFLNK